MEKSEVVKQFSFFGYYLRPNATNYILTKLENEEKSKAEETLAMIVKNVHQIMEQEKKFSTFITKEIVEDTFRLLDTQKRFESNVSDNRDNNNMTIENETYNTSNSTINSTLSAQIKESFIVLSNYGEVPFFGIEGLTKELKIHYRPHNHLLLDRDELLFKPIQRYHRMEYLLKNSKQYKYDYDKTSDKLEEALKLSEVGSLTGKKGIVSVFGLVFEINGKYFLQDPLSKVQIIFLPNLKSGSGFFHSEHYLILQGFMKNGKLNVIKILQPKLEDRLKEILGLSSEDFYGFKTKFLKDLSQLPSKNIPSSSFDNENRNIKKIRKNIYIQKELGIFCNKNCADHILIISDFSMEDENLYKKFERIIYALQTDNIKLGFMIICGPFFPNTQMGKDGEKMIMNYVQKFYAFLKKHAEFFQDLRFGLLPGFYYI